MPAPLFAIARAKTEPPSGYTVLDGALEFAEDAAQSTQIWRIRPSGGVAPYRYSLPVGDGMYQLSNDTGDDVWLERGDSGTPEAGNPEAFTIRITDKWGRTFDVSSQCNVLAAGGGDVAPILASATFNITDAYADDQTVGTVRFANSPTLPCPRVLTAQSVDGLFAVNEDTGVITVADAGLLEPDTSPTITVTATNDAGSNEKTYTINVADSSADLAPLVLRNDSGETQPAGSFAAEIGHYFPKGAVPAGSELEVRADDGSTKLTAIIRQRTTWPDGSLMFASLMPRIDSQIADSASQTIRLFKSSTPHGTSGIDISDVTSDSDIKVTGEALFGSNATWTASFNAAVANGDYWIDDDSEGGPTITAYAPLNDGASDSDTMGVWFFVTVLKAAAGGIYGYLIDALPQNGMHGKSPTTRIFKSFKIQDGSTVLKEVKPAGDDVTVVRSALYGAKSVSIESGGSGYSANSARQLVGGTIGAAATTVRIQSVSGGAITGIAIDAAVQNFAEGRTGDYSVVPSNPVSISGSGSGGSLNMTWGRIYLECDTSSFEIPHGGWNRVGYFTTTGTLPAPLEPGVGYFIHIYRSGKITVHTNSQDCGWGLNAIELTDDGSGTHTLHQAMPLEFYDAGKALCGTDGKPTFLARAGGAVAPLCWPEYDLSYRVATKLLGPRDLSKTFGSSTAKTYVPMQAGGGNASDDINWAEDTTGERPDIGYYTMWACRALHQNSEAERNRAIRNALLYAGVRGMSYMRPETKHIVNLSSNSHTGLGTGIPGITVRLNNKSYSGGGTAPTPSTETRLIHCGAPLAHAPHHMAAAYEITGRPLLLHLLMCNTHRLWLASPITTETVNSVAIGTSIFAPNGTQQPRSYAWMLSATVDLHRLMPDSYRGAAVRAMVKEILDNSATYAIQKWATLNSFMQENGFWWTNGESTWQFAYLTVGALRAKVQTENADWATFVEKLLHHLDAIRLNKGGGDAKYLAWYDRSSSVTWTSISNWSQVSFNLTSDTRYHAYGMVKWAKADGAIAVPDGMEAAVESIYNPASLPNSKAWLALTNSYGAD